MTLTMNALIEPIMMPLGDLHEWELNPRRGIYRDMGRFVASVREQGIRDPLHAWFHGGQYLLLQGHRRLRAAREIGLEEVPVIVERCAGPAEALALLMELQLEQDPFDPLEEAIGLRSLVDVGGMTAAEIGVRMNRPEVWVQQRLDILKLPEVAQDALSRRLLGHECVQLLLALESADRDLAIQEVLHPEFGDGPLEARAAERLIRDRWLARTLAARGWAANVGALCKEFPAKKGFSVVESFEDCGTYCMPYGQPQKGYRYADETIDRKELADESVTMTWGDLARRHEQAVFVVCAWKHQNGVSQVVNESVIREAEALRAERGERAVLRQKGSRGGSGGGGGGASRNEPDAGRLSLMMKRGDGKREEPKVEGWTIGWVDAEGDAHERWWGTMEETLADVRERLTGGLRCVRIHAGPGVIGTGRSD